MNSFARLLSTTALIAAVSLGMGLPKSASVHASTIALEITASNPQILSFSTTRGWLFQVNSDISVTDLGLWDSGANGFSSSHRINLWTDTGSLLAGVTMPSGTVGTLDGSTVGGGQFRYTSVSPVALSAGNSYVISANVTGDSFINDGVASITGAPEITWLAGRFGSAGSSVFPTSSVSGNKYFGPNFKFETAAVQVHEPAGAVALGITIVLLGFARRRLSRKV